LVASAFALAENRRNAHNNPKSLALEQPRPLVEARNVFSLLLRVVLSQPSHVNVDIEIDLGHARLRGFVRVAFIPAGHLVRGRFWHWRVLGISIHRQAEVYRS
jgi:hypothetical protein